MIHNLTGDILHSKAQLIAHGVAPHDHFNQGLALALRERWPAMAKDFRHWCKQNHPSPGDCWVWSGPNARIACLLTQEPAAHEGGHPGKAKLKHVSHALKQLAKIVRDEGVTSLALPRLATGVGGLDWAEVRREIEQHLGDVGAEVVVYDGFEPGRAADEPFESAAGG